jgi:hypothetical protein
MIKPDALMTMPAPSLFSGSPELEDDLDPEHLGLALLATCQMVRRLSEQLGLKSREIAMALAETAAGLLLRDDNDAHISVR